MCGLSLVVRTTRKSFEQFCCWLNGDCVGVNEATAMWNIHILSDLTYYRSPRGVYKALLPFKIKLARCMSLPWIIYGFSFGFYPPCICQLQKVIW